jgi:hypothetical protein
VQGFGAPSQQENSMLLLLELYSFSELDIKSIILDSLESKVASRIEELLVMALCKKADFSLIL